jgi:mono/diheme cytochrome c family protein
MRALPLVAALLGTAPLAISAQPVRTGAEVYGTCTACHMPTGLGLANAFPPLAGSEWVIGRVEVPIALVLHGMQGEVTVKGATYNSVMTPWGAMFSDQEIANVVTYIRSQWGNKASAATARDVARVRAATRNQKTPFTAAEIRKLYP